MKRQPAGRHHIALPAVLKGASSPDGGADYRGSNQWKR